MRKQLLSQHEPISVLIGAVRRRIKQAVAARVRHHGLTSQQFLVMITIHERGGGSLGEIAAHIRMDQPTASRIVTTLMKRNLVRIGDDPTDRRRARLFLAPAGTALAAELYAIAKEIRTATEAGFDAQERDTLRKLLHAVMANLDRYERERGGAEPPAPLPPRRNSV
jgi:DNA-binding MarR family transcriptional regulator